MTCPASKSVPCKVLTGSASPLAAPPRLEDCMTGEYKKSREQPDTIIYPFTV